MNDFTHKFLAVLQSTDIEDVAKYGFHGAEIGDICLFGEWMDEEGAFGECNILRKPDGRFFLNYADGEMIPGRITQSGKAIALLGGVTVNECTLVALSGRPIPAR